MQPDALVVELCRSRQAVMYPAPEGQQRQDVQQQQGAAGALQSLGSGSSIDEAAGGQQGSGSGSGSGGGKVSTARNLLSLSGGGLLPAFQRSMELGGASALLLRLLLGRLSARMAGSLGVSSGAEFVAAREEAEVLAAQVRIHHLGCGRAAMSGRVLRHYCLPARLLACPPACCSPQHAVSLQRTLLCASPVLPSTNAPCPCSWFLGAARLRSRQSLALCGSYVPPTARVPLHPQVPFP